jgi:hypothetical protein
VGFLENQRRKRHELSVDWDDLVSMMLLDHELELAESEGVAESARAGRAAQVRDAVIDRVGHDRVVRAFIDCDYEMKTSDKDAVVVQALEVSGYNQARQELPAVILAATIAPTSKARTAFDEPRWDDDPIEELSSTFSSASPEPELPPLPEPQAAPLGRAARDPQVMEVAKRAVRSWLERFPDVAEQAYASDDGRTSEETLVTEGCNAADATRGYIASGDSPLTIFEKQSAIAFDQAEAGVTKEWVVGFMQIRCIATGYMLHNLGHDTTMKEFARLFREFFAK